MLILTKSIIAVLLGFLLAISFGLFIVPLFRKKGLCQSVSHNLNERHLAKNGMPTMGGIIFILPVVITIIFLMVIHKLTFDINFLIVIFAFISYAILGFLDDFLKIKYQNNKGLSIITKFFCEFVIALIIFFLFILSGNTAVVSFFNFSIDLNYFYGIFILILLTGTTNAVNITDGLDGLCAGVSAIVFFTYGIIAWRLSYIISNELIAIFCFTMVGSLLGFLIFNFYPAKIFMGDLGSLSLGGALASIAMLLKIEMSLLIIGFVYVIETLSSLFQILNIKLLKRKIFLKSPLHHHFEEKGFEESEIIKIFYTITVICSLLALLYYVWY